MLEDLIREWDGEEVVVGFDEPSGTWMFVCIHSTRLGPAGGGTRMKPYAQPADALRDAMNLSEAMTLKMAAAGIPVRWREGRRRGPRSAGGRRAPPDTPALRGARRLAGRDVPHGPGREHLDGGHGSHRRAPPLRLLPERGERRIRRPRPVHRARRVPRSARRVSATRSGRIGSTIAPCSSRGSATSADRSPSNSPRTARGCW